jgi:PilZ domain-containing protein
MILRSSFDSDGQAGGAPHAARMIGERRAHPRAPAEVRASIFGCYAPGKVVIDNISKGGMEFRSEKPPGSLRHELDAWFSWEAREQEVTVRAQIVWLRPVSVGGMSRVGARFLFVEPPRRELFNDLIDAALTAEVPPSVPWPRRIQVSASLPFMFARPLREKNPFDLIIDSTERLSLEEQIELEFEPPLAEEHIRCTGRPIYIQPLADNLTDRVRVAIDPMPLAQMSAMSRLVAGQLRYKRGPCA